MGTILTTCPEGHVTESKCRCTSTHVERRQAGWCGPNCPKSPAKDAHGKPKASDFKIGEPITNEERIQALNQLVNERVKETREAAYKAAQAEYVYNNFSSR